MANNIASERRRLNLRQKDLADRLEISESTIYRWERNEASPGGPQLIAMHEIFGCSTDYLLGISNERNHIRV